MRLYIIAALLCVTSLTACSVKEERTVQQPTPAASTVVATPAPAGSTTVYTDPSTAPRSTTTVYTR